MVRVQIFRDGDAESPADYDGPRETAGIVSYLGKQAGPPSLLLDSAKAVKDFCKFTDEKGTVGESLLACCWLFSSELKIAPTCMRSRRGLQRRHAFL